MRIPITSMQVRVYPADFSGNALNIVLFQRIGTKTLSSTDGHQSQSTITILGRNNDRRTSRLPPRTGTTISRTHQSGLLITRQQITTAIRISVTRILRSAPHAHVQPHPTRRRRRKIGTRTLSWTTTQKVHLLRRLRPRDMSPTNSNTNHPKMKAVPTWAWTRKRRKKTGPSPHAPAAPRSLASLRRPRCRPSLSPSASLLALRSTSRSPAPPPPPSSPSPRQSPPRARPRCHPRHTLVSARPAGSRGFPQARQSTNARRAGCARRAGLCPQELGIRCTRWARSGGGGQTARQRNMPLDSRRWKWTSRERTRDTGRARLCA